MASSHSCLVHGNTTGALLRESFPSSLPRYATTSIQPCLRLPFSSQTQSSITCANQQAQGAFRSHVCASGNPRHHAPCGGTFKGRHQPVSSEKERRVMKRGKPSSFRRHAQNGDGGEISSTESETNVDAAPLPPAPAATVTKEKLPPQAPPQQQTLTLDDVNPVGLGRRSRQLFDDVWRRLTELGQLTRSRPVDGDLDDYDSVLIGGPMCDFAIPNAEYTTILIAGATGRVGRVLVRKLLLRGYKVKALVRSGDAEALPPSVQVVMGDLTDPGTLKAAVEGCQKVVFCATSRNRESLESLQQVDSVGVSNLVKAFQDSQHALANKRAGRSSRSKLTLAKSFSREDGLDGWELREGQLSRPSDSANGDSAALKFDTDKDAQVEALDNGCAVFSGYVYARGDYVELVQTLKMPDGVTLDRYEGLVLRVCGDGKSYSLVLETAPREGVKGQLGYMYTARFTARPGYSRIRVPFSVFRPTSAEDPPLNLAAVRKMGVRYEARRQKAQPAARPSTRAAGTNGVVRAEPSPADPLAQNSFRLEIDYIKALPGGEETDFILLSCTGAGAEPEHRENVIRAKQLGETFLRNSGLGYTIVRPGPLQEEPGGQKALVFDQGNRITQNISCADVADVCVKALHDPTARNKSFDVCYEYSSEEGQGLYELVAHLPDKSNNYLTPALALLEKNT